MEREKFGGRVGAIFALAGSAIGLGNIWRFPYMVGENGGAVFIIIYIAATLLLSLPIFFAEFIIGRRTQSNCIGAMKKLAPGTAWKWFGALSIFTPLFILSYYSVVGGWSLEYLVQACSLTFTNADAVEVRSLFGEFITGTWGPLVLFTIYLLLVLGVILGGVRKGIEKFSKLTIPLLFVLVVIIAIYSVSLPGSSAGIEYLVRPDWGKVTPATLVNALGQSFYSMSLGMGIIITYSSYIKKQENPVVTGFATGVSDFLFAIIASFAIIPAVFSAGIEPGAGPGLIFETLPFIFSSLSETMPVLSSIIAILFFLTILIAALTSSVSLMEVGVAYFVDEKKMKRSSASLLVFAVVWAAGAVCSLSFGPLKGVTLFGNNIFDIFDKFASNFLLLIGGMLTLVFVGWKMDKASVRDEFTSSGKARGSRRLFESTYFLIKYVAPVLLGIVFIANFL